MAKEAHALLCQLIKKHPLKYKTFNEGELLLQQGQNIHDVLWIELGQYSIDHTTQNGRQLSLGNYFAHDRLLGEIEFLTQSPCQFDIRAIEPITAKVIPTSLLCEWLQQEPKIALWLSHSLSHNYQTTSSEAINRALFPLVYNIAKDLEQRYKRAKPQLSFDLAYKEAQRFGCSERTYSRAIHQLLDLGLVKKGQQTIEVVDIDALSNYLAQSQKGKPL